MNKSIVRKCNNQEILVILAVMALALMTITSVIVISDRSVAEATPDWDGTSNIPSGSTEYVSGVVEVTGNPTISGSLIVTSEATLTVNEDATLTISNNAKTTIDPEAIIINNGTIVGFLVQLNESYTYNGESQTPSVSLIDSTVPSSISSSLNNGTNAGVYSGSVTAWFDGNSSTVYFDWTIAAKELTISGATAENRAYDGSTDVTVSGGELVGVVDGDTVGIDESSDIVGAIDSVNVDTGISVTVSGYALSGADSGNYSLAQPTGVTVDISPCVITLIDNFTCEYNGSTNFITTTSGVNSETVTLNVTSYDMNVGTYNFTNGSVPNEGTYTIAIFDANYTVSDSSSATLSVAPVSNIFETLEIVADYSDHTVVYVPVIDTTVSCDSLNYSWYVNGTLISQNEDYLLESDYIGMSIELIVSSVNSLSGISDTVYSSYYVISMHYADESVVEMFYPSNTEIETSLGPDQLEGYAFDGWYYNTYGDDKVEACDHFDVGNIYVESRFVVPNETRTSYFISMEPTSADDEYITFTVTMSSEDDTPMKNMPDLYCYYGIYSGSGVKVAAYGFTVSDKIDDCGNASWTINIENMPGFGYVNVQIMNSSVCLIPIGPQSECTYTATSYTIDVTANNGSIAENTSIEVGVGQSQTVNYSADEGYHLESVTVDDVDVTEEYPESYTFSNVIANHSIVVVCTPDEE